MSDRPRGPESAPSSESQRRRRKGRRLAIAAGAAAAALLLWLWTRPGFDLSTPEKCLGTFQRAMDGRRWSEAERCLSARCREHYRAPIADRRLFDFYSPYGYVLAANYRLIPDWRVRSVRTFGERATARISTNVPIIRTEQFGFDLELVREPDGLWRVDGPLEDFDRNYEELIPEEAKGWAAAKERK
jgi:hypothetical protein